MSLDLINVLDLLHFFITAEWLKGQFVICCEFNWVKIFHLFWTGTYFDEHFIYELITLFTAKEMLPLNNH